MKDDVLTVKSVVEKVLSVDSNARNNDTWLIFSVLRELGFKIFIPYSQMDYMPSFESITRCRRKLQEEGKYLAEQKIKDNRSIEETKMETINDWFK